MSLEPEIVLFNTLSRRKEVLKTEVPDQVTMYVCGPTVYNYAHIGNARPAVLFDILARLLRRQYSKVVYARNLTDIDDKINEAALLAGLPIASITNKYIAAYHVDMEALGVLPPNLEPRVTEHVPDILALIEKLCDSGHAYVAEGHVLFDVTSYAEYGHLSGRRGAQMRAGARIEVAPYKRDPLDFVLWKPSNAQQPGWDSPWGRGRPGWHIECSAMIGKHLGTTIDIHGGGQDLIFPHHENEVAQGTCANNGQLYCRTWVHNSFVTVDGQKMSKSLGNVLLVSDLLAHTPGEAIRYALLMTHYRHPLDWNPIRLGRAKAMVIRFYRALSRVKGIPASMNEQPDPTVLAAVAEDLNTPLALARLQRLIPLLGKTSDETAVAKAKGILLASGAVLGLLQQDPDSVLTQFARGGETPDPAWIADLIDSRTTARQEGDYAKADELRQQLANAGVALEDSGGVTHWRLTNMEVL